MSFLYKTEIDTVPNRVVTVKETDLPDRGEDSRQRDDLNRLRNLCL